MRSRRSPRGFGRSVQHRTAMVAELLDLVTSGHMELAGSDPNGEPTFGLTAVGRRARAENVSVPDAATEPTQ
jgi:hypothetical protein